jgi:hypothetical protein
MGFDLEIIFQGMCTFVPDPDNGKLWVLMRDSVVPQKVPGGVVPAHAAVIRFPLESLAKGTPGFGMRRMDNLDVQIAGQKTGGVQYVDFDPKTSQPTTAPGSTPAPDSFAWVAPLEEACAKRNLAGRGVINPLFLKPLGELPLQDANRLAARFVFTQGTVSTQKLAGIGGQVLDSVFHPPASATANGSDLIQPTAAMVSVKTHIDADEVTFEGRTLRTGETTRPLKLKPFGPENTLRIRVLNEEADTLVGLQTPPIQVGKARVQDRIFLSMFEFCKNPPAAADRPMPVPAGVSNRFPSPPWDIILGGSPPCSPARGLLE